MPARSSTLGHQVVVAAAPFIPAGALRVLARDTKLSAHVCGGPAIVEGEDAAGLPVSHYRDLPGLEQRGLGVVECSALPVMPCAAPLPGPRRRPERWPP